MKSWVPALGGLVGLLLLQAVLDPSFFVISARDGRLVGSLIDVLTRSAPIVIVALGMGLVIATGGVDLSVGALAAISGVIAACLVARPETSPLAPLMLGTPMIVIFAVALLGAMLGGLFNGFLVSKARIQPIVATLILMTGGRGIAQWLSAGQIINYQSADLAWPARGSLFLVPIPIWLALALLTVVALLTQAFPFGRLIAATGANEEAAEYVGIAVGRLKLVLYGFCGLCAGIAGLIWSGDIQAADASNIGLYSELDAILAVALGGASLSGGKFNLWATALGAVLMRLMTTMLLTRGVEPPVAMILKGLLVVLVCALGSPVVRGWVRRTA